MRWKGSLVSCLPFPTVSPSFIYAATSDILFPYPRPLPHGRVYSLCFPRPLIWSPSFSITPFSLLGMLISVFGWDSSMPKPFWWDQPPIWEDLDGSRCRDRLSSIISMISVRFFIASSHLMRFCDPYRHDRLVRPHGSFLHQDSGWLSLPRRPSVSLSHLDSLVGHLR
jgi:hypothetical protein